MAKDKKNKAEKASKGVASDDFARPSDAPAGGDSWKFTSEENVGKLFLIKPLRSEEHVDKFDKRGGMKEHIVADVVALDEKKPEKSEEHTNVWLFGGWIMGAVRGYIGERLVLARLAQEKDKGSATGYVWKLEDGDDDDVKVAKAYLESVDPFSQGGGKKSKSDDDGDEPKKAKKKKAKK